MKNILFACAIIPAVISTGAAAEIPDRATLEENSTLSREYGTTWGGWRSRWLRLPKQPETGEDAPGPLACYRKELVLPAAPRRAELTLYMRSGGAIWYHDGTISSASYWFAVNGRTIIEPRQTRFQYPGLANVDLTPYLRAGRNVLAFHGRPSGMHLSAFTAEGIVFCEDGSTVRILSDDWTGGWDLPEGWDDPGAVMELPALDESDNPLHGPPDTVYPRPYFGPIQIHPVAPRGEPIFDEDQPIELKLTLLNLQACSPDTPSLAYEVFDENSREIIELGAVELSPEGELDLAGSLLQSPLPRGSYQFRFVLTAGGEEMDRRMFETAVVGRIPQPLTDGDYYEDGLELREIWSVDCTQEPLDAGSFVASNANWGHRPPEDGWREVATLVEEGPAGRYRTLAENNHMDFFAYSYKLESLYKPHLAVVEWPDDARRNFIVHVAESASLSYPDGIWGAAHYRQRGHQRSEAAVIASQDLHLERSNRMQKLHLLFWPNAPEGSVHICNVPRGEKPAAAARITVYEIVNELPALKIADAGDRLIGPMTERGLWTTASSYYAGPLGVYFTTHLGSKKHPEYYRNWAATFENLIKRLRFSGQNAYFMGQLMYQGTLYPSKLGIFNQDNYGGGDAVCDPVPLMLRMFEHNGISLISGIEICTLPGLHPIQPTQEAIRAGRASPLFMITREGRVFPLHTRRMGPGVYVGSGRPRDGKAVLPALNYLHPEVHDNLLAIIGELVDTYEDYPAWKGVALNLSGFLGPLNPNFIGGDDPLWGGYGDWTIALFEEETGLRVPGEAADPERFEKRYQWLTGPSREEWVQWRCDKYTELYRRLRDRITAGRPNLDLHIFLGEPSDDLAAEIMLRDDPASRGLELLREFGFDLAAVKNEPGIVLSYTYAVAGSGWSFGQKDDWWREMTWNHDWQKLFADDGRGGAFLKGSIPHYGAYTFPKDRWLFTGVANRQGYFWSTYVVESFVHVMARSNPTVMPHTWMDMSESMGRIHEQRLFARAYRSLPNGEYERLTGDGRDKNIWMASTHDNGAEYLYAANLHWWDVDTTIDFAEGSRVHDLIADAPLTLDGGRYVMRLGPYEVRTFRVEPAGAARAAETAPPEAAAGIINARLAEFTDTARKARGREAELKHLPGWSAVAPLEAAAQKITALVDAGDWTRAYEQALSRPTLHKNETVIQQVLEVVPFLVTGPFGRLEDTDIEKFGRSNPEVRADFRGMETPFLDEYADAEGVVLKTSFRPDKAAKHAVYQQEESSWQTALLTDKLDLESLSGPGHPYWMVIYAYTEVFSPETRVAALRAGNDHALWAWINDRQILRHGGHGTHRQGQGPSAPDKHVVEVRLQQGWNRVLLKALYRPGIRIHFRLTDPDGQALGDLMYRTNDS